MAVARTAASNTSVQPADLHRNYVGGVERGARNVSLINIVKLARDLKVRPAKLIEPIR